MVQRRERARARAADSAERRARVGGVPGGERARPAPRAANTRNTYSAKKLSIVLTKRTHEARSFLRRSAARSAARRLARAARKLRWMETTALRRRLSSRSSLCSSSSSGVSFRLNSMCIRFLFSADAASATSAARTASSRRLVSTRDAENSERASSSDERAAFARVSTSPEARAPFAVASRSASSASCVSLEAATSLTCAAAVIASAATTSSRRSFKDLRPSSWLVNPSASSSAVVLISFKPCSNFWTFFLCSSSMNLMVSSASF